MGPDPAPARAERQVPYGTRRSDGRLADKIGGARVTIFSLRRFMGFYVTCIGLCWWFYALKGAESPS
ncbi:hypothetical protein [Streptomyces sp. NPDC058247]|uniref:hypothetical protein n=1 Tax=Streptomyces sp. NPDC058247 TaxID=3346401 RepID=UPI0036E98A00